MTDSTKWADMQNLPWNFPPISGNRNDDLVIENAALETWGVLQNTKETFILSFEFINTHIYCHFTNCTWLSWNKNRKGIQVLFDHAISDQWLINSTETLGFVYSYLFCFCCVTNATVSFPANAWRLYEESLLLTTRTCAQLIYNFYGVFY